MLQTTDLGILLLIGAVFFLIGILGGGFEASAVKIPSIGKTSRVVSASIGAIFMGIAVLRLVFPNVPSPTSVNPPIETPTSSISSTDISIAPTGVNLPAETPSLSASSTNIDIFPTSRPTPTCPDLDPSQAKQRLKPAILFDEAHRNGLSLSEEKARQIDPRPQLFPYAGDLADYIRQQGYDFEANETGSYSLTGLSSYDLLIISVGASTFYSNDCENEAIKTFVENGGGLLILGDGQQSNHINTLLEPLGVRMTGHPVVAVSVSDLPENFWVTGFLGHPATRNITQAWFNWGTNIEILDNTWSTLMNSPEGVWLDENSDGIAGEVEPHGPFVLGAAREMGLGRIIVYADNNVWDYYRDPNYPMFLSMIRWAIGDPTRPLP